MAAVFETKTLNREEEELKKLQAETYRTLIEALKMGREAWWHPFIAGAGFLVATAACLKVLDAVF
jgi:hypothetical protein